MPVQIKVATATTRIAAEEVGEAGSKAGRGEVEEGGKEVVVEVEAPVTTSLVIIEVMIELGQPMVRPRFVYFCRRTVYMDHSE